MASLGGGGGGGGSSGGGGGIMSLIGDLLVPIKPPQHPPGPPTQPHQVQPRPVAPLMGGQQTQLPAIQYLQQLGGLGLY